MILRTGVGLCLATLISLLSACGGTPKPQVKPGPSIPGVSLSGTWYSAEFGDMKVVHAGKQISGSYEDPRSPDHNGHFRGQLIGDLVRLEWIKPGNVRAAIPPNRGRAWLRLSRDGKKMAGMWGFDESEDDGGVWNAEKSQFD